MTLCLHLTREKVAFHEHFIRYERVNVLQNLLNLYMVSILRDRSLKTFH